MTVQRCLARHHPTSSKSMSGMYHVQIIGYSEEEVLRFDDASNRREKRVIGRLTLGARIGRERGGKQMTKGET